MNKNVLLKRAMACITMLAMLITSIVLDVPEPAEAAADQYYYKGKFKFTSEGNSDKNKGSYFSLNRAQKKQAEQCVNFGNTNNSEIYTFTVTVEAPKSFGDSGAECSIYAKKRTKDAKTKKDVWVDLFAYSSSFAFVKDTNKNTSIYQVVTYVQVDKISSNNGKLWIDIDPGTFSGEVEVKAVSSHQNATKLLNMQTRGNKVTLNAPSGWLCEYIDVKNAAGVKDISTLVWGTYVTQEDYFTEHMKSNENMFLRKKLSKEKKKATFNFEKTGDYVFRARLVPKTLNGMALTVLYVYCRSKVTVTKSTKSSKKVNVDVTKPKITGAKNGGKYSRAVTVKVADKKAKGDTWASGIKSFKYKIGSGSWKTVSGKSKKFKQKSKKQKIRVRVTDNERNASEIKFTIEKK